MKQMKRLLSALLCAALCLVCAVSAVAEVTPLFGDANDDGTIGMKDILVLRSYLADLYVDINMVCADVDASGTVTTKDVLLLRKYMAGLAVTLGEGANPKNIFLSEGEDIRLSLYDVQPEGEYGYSLLVAAENLTDDRTADVSILGVSLNDAMVMPTWAVTLEPGEGKVDLLTLNLEEIFPAYGETIEKIGLYFAAVDTETSELLDCGKQPIFYYPTDGEETYNTRERTPAGGVAILDNSEVKIVALGTETDTEQLFTVLGTYVENHTGKTMVYVCDGATVNGQKVEALWLSVLLPHTSMRSGLIMGCNELAEKGITSIDTISFSLDAYEVAVLTSEDEPVPLHSYNVTYTAQ